MEHDRTDSALIVLQEPCRRQAASGEERKGFEIPLDAGAFLLDPWRPHL
jgi:hypothetical protein